MDANLDLLVFWIIKVDFLIYKPYFFVVIGSHCCSSFVNWYIGRFLVINSYLGTSYENVLLHNFEIFNEISSLFVDRLSPIIAINPD